MRKFALLMVYSVDVNGQKRKRLARKRRLKIVSSNVRGLISGTKRGPLLDSLHLRNIFAAGLQEIWGEGEEQLEHCQAGSVSESQLAASWGN